MDTTRGGDSLQQGTGRGAAVEFNYQLTAADIEEALQGFRDRTTRNAVQAEGCSGLLLLASVQG